MNKEDVSYLVELLSEGDIHCVERITAFLVAIGERHTLIDEDVLLKVYKQIDFREYINTEHQRYISMKSKVVDCITKKTYE